jgi:hypothetical protein
MLRIQMRTGIIIAESILIVILSVSLGWYYYHVQNSLQYTGDPLYDPNGYQTMWIVGTPTNNGMFTAAYSSLGPAVEPDGPVQCPGKNDEQLPGSLLRSMRQVEYPEHYRTKTSPHRAVHLQR